MYIAWLFPKLLHLSKHNFNICDFISSMYLFTSIDATKSHLSSKISFYLLGLWLIIAWLFLSFCFLYLSASVSGINFIRMWKIILLVMMIINWIIKSFYTRRYIYHMSHHNVLACIEQWYDLVIYKYIKSIKSSHRRIL